MAISRFLNWVFPSVCSGCGMLGSALCSRCAQLLCLRRAGVVEGDWFLEGMVVAMDYGVPLARVLVKNFKYRFVRELARPLGVLVARQLIRTGVRCDWVTAVPLHSRRLRWRGFNQAELLGRVVAKEFRVPFLPLLKRSVDTGSQTKLGRSERRANTEGAFSLIAPEDLWGKGIVVDDVAATGATLEACARVLREAGAEAVWGAVVLKNRF